MSWQEWFKNFWAFSKPERKGVLLLLCLIVTAYCLPYLIGYLQLNNTGDQSDDRSFQKEVERFQKELAQKREKNQYNQQTDKAKHELDPFPFNPNKLTKQKGRELGLPTHIVDNIIKFRKAGGHFDQPRDLADIYGLADTTFQTLKPYIRIPQNQSSSHHTNQRHEEAFEPDSLFAFNPNNMSIKKWRQLGLPDRVILNIKSYEEQGGFFTKKEDLDSVYGMDKEMYATLEPYIKLDKSGNDKQNEPIRPSKEKQKVSEKPSKVDINKADSIALLQVKGIGPFYAKMILEERRKLGGFVRKEQLREVYGMQKKYGDDSLTVYQRIKDRIKVSDPQTKRINLNSASVDQLADHPYIDYNLAEGIVNYRQQHGRFDSLADVNELYLVDKRLSRKLKPYLHIP